jgi:hypothetical protein
MPPLTSISYPESPKVGDGVRVLAQVGEHGTFVYRRKGSPTAILDRESPNYSKIVVGSIVGGKVIRQLESSVLISVDSLDPPIALTGIRAEQSMGQPRPLGRSREGKALLFHDSAPLTADIRVGDLVSGKVIQETEAYVMVYPTERTPSGTSEEVRQETTAASQELFPPIHPFVPWILNELVPASLGNLRPEIVGLVEATNAWQAFEDLVTSAFRVLDFGEVHPLGWHKTGQNYPDGYVFCPNRKAREYIIAYDTKQRSSPAGYSHSVDDVRAFEDYLRSVPYYQSVRRRAIVVVCHKFAKDPPSIRDGTVTYIPADLLAKLVTLKVMNESLISHEVLEPLLFSGTILDVTAVDHWKEHHNLRDLGRGQVAPR